MNNEEISGENQGERFELDDIQRIELKKPTAIGKAAGITIGLGIGFLSMAIITAFIVALIGI